METAMAVNLSKRDDEQQHTVTTASVKARLHAL